MKKVTILVCTPDMGSETTRQCLDSLFAHTPSDLYKLVIADNLGDPTFSHPHEINNQLKTLDTDYLVCLDDDVVLTAGWLEALLKVAESDPSVGAVGCMHLNADGSINHSGGWIHREGRSEHFRRLLSSTKFVPYVCSACVLIRKTPMSFDETFSKYWHEGEFCLRLWEAGFRVAVAPHQVYHLANQQMLQQHGKEAVQTARERDRAVFIKKWVETGRIDKLYDSIGHQLTLATPAPPPRAERRASSLPSLRVLVMEKLKVLRSEKECRSVAVFGAGKHTAWLESILENQGSVPKVVALLDDHPAGKMPMLGLHPTRADQFDAKTVDAIILSSDCRQSEMAVRCRDLFGLKVKLVDLYKGLPPGPYDKE